MTGPPPGRARTRRAAPVRAAVGAILLLLLLAALPVLRQAPGAPGEVLAGGLSIEWWYGGLLAPVAGWLMAIWAVAGPRGPRPRAPRRGAPEGPEADPATAADASG